MNFRISHISLILGLLGLMLPPISPAQGAPTYSAADAAKHVNETAIVRDVVANIHQSAKGNVFLNMGGRYPDQKFTAFVPASSAASVPNPGQYEGQTVSVSGKIVLYKGKAEIIVKSEAQVRVQP